MLPHSAHACMTSAATSEQLLRRGYDSQLSLLTQDKDYPTADTAVVTAVTQSHSSALYASDIQAEGYDEYVYSVTAISEHEHEHELDVSI